MALTRMDRFAAGIQADNGTVAREERLAGYENRLQDALDRQADANLRARQRRYAANAEIARHEPGRFSAQETRALLGMTHTQYGDVARMDDSERAGLRQHELDMLKQEGQNKIGVAHETALGMRGQGAEAAQIRANADTEIAGINALSQEETAWINAGSAEQIAKNNSESALKTEQERQKGALGVAKEQGRASDYASDAKVDAEREKGLQIAAQNVREEQIAKWKMQHEKELAQMRLDGQIPDDREARGLIVLQNLTENKGKTISQILQEMRKAQRR